MSDPAVHPATARTEPYQPQNHVRIVTAASLFDGHDAAINIMRRLIQAQGCEVIHLGHNRSVLDVVRAAIQEDADAILEVIQEIDVPPIQVRIDCMVSEVYSDLTMDRETSLLIENLFGEKINLSGPLDSQGNLLPAFPGARPYHSAHERGVKIIGATSHYVTAELDAGPIIEQDVVHVSHKDSVEDMVRIGRDLEKIVLARAVRHHVHHDLLVYENRTVVFE